MSSEDRWMALDVGHKRIGVAITDPLKILARPLQSLSRRTLEQDVRAIRSLLQEHAVSCLIIGLPRHLDGRPSAITEMIETLLEKLTEHCSIDVKWCDERLSSKEAEERMAQVKIPLEERRGMRDAYAAAIILERFIEEGAAQL